MKVFVFILLASALLLAGCAQNTPSEPTQSPAVSTTSPAPAGTETPADLTPTPASPHEDVDAVDAEHDSHEGHDH